MSSEARRDFDAWFVEHYEELVRSARKLHPDHYDLVHHTYLRCVKALKKNENILENLPGYFHTSMWISATDHFRRLYEINETTDIEPVSDYDLSYAIKKEEALILANHLPWFHRTVLSLYLEGWNLAELSRETGISVDVLYQSIRFSKKKLRYVISQRTNKK